MAKEKKENTEKKSSTKKVAKSDFAEFKEKMENTQKLPGENFRKLAERIGVAPEKVADFKQYLNSNKHEQKRKK